MAFRFGFDQRLFFKGIIHLGVLGLGMGGVQEEPGREGFPFYTYSRCSAEIILAGKWRLRGTLNSRYHFSLAVRNAFLQSGPISR